MSQTEYEAAISDFLRSKGATRCPTACVAPTHGSTAETDRAALRDHENARQGAVPNAGSGTGYRISKRVSLSCVNRKSSANKFDLGGPDAAQPLRRRLSGNPSTYGGIT